jgi:hypothetical protein
VAVYRITAVRRSKAHGHVTKVEFRKDTGTKLKKVQNADVKEVRSMIEAGHRFYTFGSSSLASAAVLPFTAMHNGIAVKTIRSASGAATDNNLGEIATF